MKPRSWCLALALALAACEPAAPLPPTLDAGDGFDPCAESGLSPQCPAVSGLVLQPIPPAAGNRFGDDEAAAALGYQLFFDLQSLSPALIRCASCHVPEQGFTTRVSQPRGVALSPRNALSLMNAARTFPHFWDGSADSVWSQALAAIERDAELGGDRLWVARQVTTAYAASWTALFGPPPDLSALPVHGKPGDPAWDTLPAETKAVVDGVFVNVGKALEAYVRRLARGPSAFDRFAAGDSTALSAQQRRGAALFFRSGCAQCHAGPNFSDGRFHRLDAPLPADPTLRAVAALDRGRSAGLPALQQSEFNATSRYFDADAGQAPPIDLTWLDDGYFLTPSLRNVTLTGPWGHAGVFPTLDAVIRFHLGGGGPNCGVLTPYTRSDEDVQALEAFLASLEGAPAPLRWTSWPGAYP